MISSRDELEFYLDADLISLGMKRPRPRLFGDDTWKYQRMRRRYEYALNCLRSPRYWPIRFYRRYRCKIFGRIQIADRIAISARAIVDRSFTQPDISIGGIPAEQLSEKVASDYIIRGAELAAKAKVK